MEEAGKIIRVGMNSSIGRIHTQAKKRRERVLALLKVECLTYQEIANRVGISRERVRQIAYKNLDNYDGNKRFSSCRVAKNRMAVLAKPRFKSLVDRLEQYKLVYDPVFTRSSRTRIHSSLILVNGYKCKLQLFMRRNGYYIFHPAQNRDYDFSLVWYEKEDIWLVLPVDKIPPAHTMFLLEPNIDYPGGFTHRHDWPDYKEAWNLLKNAQK